MDRWRPAWPGECGRSRAATTVASPAAGAAPTTSAAACRPAVLDYGTLPGGLHSEIIAGNRHGVLVGDSEDAAGRAHAVRWVGRTPVDLGAASDAWAADINDSGVIVGNSADSHEPGTTERAFIWRSGNLRLLPGLGGATYVRRINDSGVATGSAHDRTGSERPVVWRNGVLHRLAMPAGYANASGIGINDAGDVVGTAYGPHPGMAWYWSASGVSRPLDNTSGYAQANVIDNQGRAYGIRVIAGAKHADAALWRRPGHERSLGHLAAGTFSFALGANGLGDVVGVGDYIPEGESHVLLTAVTRSRPLTLLPLSGNYNDPSDAHYVSETRPVAVGGKSATGIGDDVHATLWTCAWRQAFEPPTSASELPPGTGSTSQLRRDSIRDRLRAR